MKGASAAAGMMLLGLWVGGCTGTIGDSPGNEGNAPDEPKGNAPPRPGAPPASGSSPMPGVPPVGPSAKPPATCGKGPLVPSSSLRRLTDTEYENTVRDLLGSLPAGLDLPGDGKVGLYPSNAALGVSELFASQYEEAAARLAPLVLPRVEKLAPCDAKAMGEEGCVRAHIAAFGKRAYRRPLLAPEVDGLATLYRGRRAAAVSHTDALGTVFEAMLQSPSFLYHVERGTGSGGEVAPLSPFEVASNVF